MNACSGYIYDVDHIFRWLYIYIYDVDYILCWQDEKRLREALFFANACGALTVTQRGAIPAMPTKEAVLQALGKVDA